MAQNQRPEEAPEITPQVLHLRDVLKWVRQGRIRVPRFQRDFTWDRSKMLSLFDSVCRQYPIGSLLLWEPTTKRAMSDQLGPLRLPNLETGQLLVLDGQQRLTTLAGVLLRDELPVNIDADRDPGRWTMYYDAEVKSFAYSDDDPSPLPPWVVRVSELMSTKGLYAAAQRIMNAKHTAPNQTTCETHVERIEAVSAALATYRLPLVIFATDSTSLVVESFTRLNRRTQKIESDEMISALTFDETDGQETFRLASHIDEILSQIKKTGFGEVERATVLRVVLLAVGLDPFRTEWEKLAEDTRGKAAGALPAAIEEARRGILAAVDFLGEEGIPNSRLLPYSMQLVGLAAFFGSCTGVPSESQRTLLRRWLWVTGFAQVFGGLNPSRQRVQLESLRERVSQDPAATQIEGIDLTTPAAPFPERYDLRSARVRALLCVMLRRNVFKPDGNSIDVKEMARDVLERGPEALAWICARVPTKQGVPSLASSPANRIFDVAPRKRAQAKNWLLAIDDTLFGIGEDRRAEILRSHYISDEAWAALNNGDHPGFVMERMRTLMEMERRFMKEKGVVPPTVQTAAPSASDVEEEAPLSENPEE